jgi:hypothetical protein
MDVRVYSHLFQFWYQIIHGASGLRRFACFIVFENRFLNLRVHSGGSFAVMAIYEILHFVEHHLALSEKNI